jgi:hypothetical protein
MKESEALSKSLASRCADGPNRVAGRATREAKRSVNPKSDVPRKSFDFANPFVRKSVCDGANLREGGRTDPPNPLLRNNRDVPPKESDPVNLRLVENRLVPQKLSVPSRTKLPANGPDRNPVDGDQVFEAGNTPVATKLVDAVNLIEAVK